MAVATRVDASGVVKKLKTVVENDEPVQPPVQTQRKGVPSGAPFTTTGPVGEDSRPFSIYNFLRNGCASGDWETAKHERYTMERFKKALRDTGCLLQHESSNVGWWLPVNIGYFGEQLTSNDAAAADVDYVCKSMNAGAMTQTDPDEEEWLMRKGIIRKSSPMSAFVDQYGGTLVAPPTQGEVIPLIRPQAALLASGATGMALPPNGRYVAPRIISAPGATAVGESQTATTSDMGTDFMTLTAKKISGAVIISDEASQYTSGTLDNWVKTTLGQSLGLKIDQYGFYGTGGNLIPDGLLSPLYASQIYNVETQSAAQVTAGGPAFRGIGANGNQLLPQYADLFEAVIGERSFNMDTETGAFILRPGAWATVTAARADAVTPGDTRGVKVDVTRRTDEGQPNQWAKKKVTRTTNILGNLTKGTGSNLQDVFYGIWKYCTVATYGAIQFQEGHNGNTFLAGQRIMKGNLYGDIGFQYPAGFLAYRYVQGAQGLM